MMSMRIKPIPPTMRRVCFVLRHKPASFWAMVPPPFFAAEAASGMPFPQPGRAGPCPVGGGVLFLQPFLLPQAEMGLLDASWGFSMTDFRQ